MNEAQLLPHQVDFLYDDYTPNIALCGGFGCGKSAAGALKLIDLALKNPGCIGLVWGLTSATLKDTILRDLDQILSGEHASIPQVAIPYKVNISTMIFTLMPKGQKPSIIRPCTADQNIVGINAAFFVADELDVLPKDKARQVWNDLSARVRVGKVNQKCATTTPEGFKFLYEFFEKEVNDKPELAAKRKLVRGCLLDNPWVPDSYVENILETRTAKQIQAYVYGHFVAFNSSTVYHDYDRKHNNTKLTIDHFPNHALWVGMDFNVDQMSAVICVDDGGAIYALDELISMKKDPTIRDTAAMIVKLKQRFPNRKLIICPDASGVQRTANSPGTNIEQLKMAGYEVEYKGGRSVEDRINSVNTLICNSKGVRRLLVNVDKCPQLVEALEQQVYDKNDNPDKSQGIDHGLDALGYVVMQRYPIRAHQMLQARLSA